MNQSRQVVTRLVKAVKAIDETAFLRRKDESVDTSRANLVNVITESGYCFGMDYRVHKTRPDEE